MTQNRELAYRTEKYLIHHKNQPTKMPTARPVTAYSCFNFYQTPTANVTTVLALSPSGIQAQSSIFTNYFDMFRFYRIKHYRVSIFSVDPTNVPPSSGCTLANQLLTDAGVVTGDINDIETPNQKQINLNPATLQSSNFLEMTEQKLRKLSQWLTTDDGSDDFINSYGLIVLAKNSGASWASFNDYSVQIHMEIEFKGQIDPIQVSTKMETLNEENQKLKASLAALTSQ